MVASVLGIAITPLTRPFTHHLPDRGAALNLSAGLVITTYLAWIAGSLRLVPYNRTTAWAWVAVLVVVSLGATGFPARRRPVPSLESIKRWAHVEIVFGVILLVYVLLQIHNPRTQLHLGDDGLDVGIVNSLARTSWFPPGDFWLSGVSLNYYYLGYLNQSLFLRLTGTSGSVGFNLGVPMVMALTTTVIYTAGWALTDRKLAGLFAAIAVGFTHNLDLAWQAITLRTISGLDWVASEHLVPASLSDSPFATFTISELHSHFLSLPILALTAAVTYAWASTPRDDDKSVRRAVGLIGIGIILGAVIPTNYYHAPVAFGLWLAVGLATAMARRNSRLFLDSLAGGAIGIVAYLPFHLTFHVNPTVHVAWNRDLTSLRAIIALFLIFYAPLAFGTVLTLGMPPKSARGTKSIGAVGASAATLLLALGVAVMTGQINSGAATFAAVLIVATTCLVQAILERADAVTVFAWCAATVGSAALAGIEVITIDAPTTTGSMRLNVAWKTYLAVWILFSHASSVGVSHLLDLRHGRLAVAVGRAGVSSCVVLIALACASGFLLARGRMEELRNNYGLNGLRFVESAPPGQRADFAAAAWLNAHARDADVVLEAAGGEESPYARISSTTGLATVLGWFHTERDYHGPLPTLSQRLRDVEAIYLDRDPVRTVKLLSEYHVRFIVVGYVEQRAYKTVDRAGLERIARPVFRAGETEVLEFPAGNTARPQ